MNRQRKTLQHKDMRRMPPMRRLGPLLMAAASLLGSGSLHAGANAELAPSTYDFGGVDVGSSSIDHAFTLTNSGDAALQVIGAATPAEFPTSGNNCPNLLAVGASCVFNVAFAPAVTGLRNGTLTVYTDGGNPLASLSGTGGGAQATADLAPSTSDFGVLQIGGNSPPKVFTLSNNGTGPLTVLLAAVSNQFLIQNNSCPAASTLLAPGDSCTYGVDFAPLAAGPLVGTLTISTSLGDQTADLHGIGVDGTADIQLSPVNFDFGHIAPGNSSADHAFTLTNNGGAAVTVTGAALPAAFPSTNNCPGSLAAGASCVFNVHFSPASLGTSSGALKVYTDGGDAYAGLRGTGTNDAPAAPLVSVSGGTASYAGTPVAVDSGLTITDADSVTLAIASVQITTNLHADQDLLSFTNDGTMNDITGSYDGSGTLTLSSAGGTATLGQWQSALRAVRYANTSATPNLGDRSVGFTVNDGGLDSNTATRTITLLSDAAPAAISFAPLSGVARSTALTSNSITVTDVNTSIAVAVSGGSYAINGGPDTSAPGSAYPGDAITVRQTSSANFSTTTTATLTIGSGSDAQSADFTVTTLAADTTPSAFGFGSRDEVPVGSTQTSGTVTPDGFNDSTTVSVVGGQYTINGGNFTATSGSFNPGDEVAVRVTASDQFSTAASVQLTIGGVTGSFAVTTVAADTTPDAFAFGTVNDVARSSLQTSNTVTISGLNTLAPVTISGGSYRINGGSFTSAAGTVANGDSVAVRQVASNHFSTTTTATLTIGAGSGAVSAPYQVTTVAAMRDPDAFTFGAVGGVEPGSTQTSDAITVSGTNASSPIRISGGSYSINGRAFTSSAGTVRSGDRVAVRTTASPVFSSTVTVTTTIGATQGTYRVTTQAADTTPDTFVFGSVGGVLPGSLQTSASVVISGINTGSPVHVSGGQYRINDGTYTDAPGTVFAGDHVTLQQQAPPGFGETSQATLTIGGVSGSFAVTTTTMAVNRKHGGGSLGAGLLIVLLSLGLWRGSATHRRSIQLRRR